MFNNRLIDSKFVSTNNSLESGAAAATGKFLNQVKSVPKNIELASAGGGLVPQLNKGQQNQSSSTVKTGSDVSPNVTSPPSGTSLDSNSELPTDTLSGLGRFDHQPTLSISFLVPTNSSIFLIGDGCSFENLTLPSLQSLDLEKTRTL